MMRTCNKISLFLLLALLSPIRSHSSEESKETEGSDTKTYLDLLNKIEDGGYDEGLFVVYDYSQGQAGQIDTVLHLDLSITDLGVDYPALDYDEARDGEEEFDWSMLSSSVEEVEDTGVVLSPVDR